MNQAEADLICAYVKSLVGSVPTTGTIPPNPGTPPVTPPVTPPPPSAPPGTIDGLRVKYIDLDYEVQATTDTGSKLDKQVVAARMVKGAWVTLFLFQSGQQSHCRYWVTADPNLPPVWAHFGGGYIPVHVGEYVVIRDEGYPFRDTLAVKVYP